jgi:hypothetical protein
MHAASPRTLGDEGGVNTRRKIRIYAASIGTDTVISTEKSEGLPRTPERRAHSRPAAARARAFTFSNSAASAGMA